MKITTDDLRRLRACDDAREWFGATFPVGAELRDVLVACDRDDWVCWYACKLSESYRYWCAGEAFASAYSATKNERLAQYVRNVTPDNWREARSAADAASADAAAYAAAYAAAASAASAAAAYAAAYADAARKLEYKKLRAETERVLLSLEMAGGEARP